MNLSYFISVNFPPPESNDRKIADFISAKQVKQGIKKMWSILPAAYIYGDV